MNTYILSLFILGLVMLSLQESQAQTTEKTKEVRNLGRCGSFQGDKMCRFRCFFVGYRNGACLDADDTEVNGKEGECICTGKKSGLGGLFSRTTTSRTTTAATTAMPTGPTDPTDPQP